MADKRFDILGLGVVAVDDIVHVEHYPSADEKSPVLAQERVLGGLVGTALAAAATLGARCGYLGVLGDDDLSAAARDGLGKVGVDTTFVSLDAAARPVHSIIIADDTAHTRNIFFNEQQLVAPLPSAVSPDVLAQARVLLVDHVYAAAAAHACQVARQFKMPSVADVETAWNSPIKELLAVVDHLIVSHHCATAITGDSSPQGAVSRLACMHPRACTVVTCGRDGCYYVAADGIVRHRAAHEVKAMDTTGCGDVFHGAYAWALAQGRDLEGCLQSASAAAAVFASRPPGWSHLPDCADLMKLLRHEAR